VAWWREACRCCAVGGAPSTRAPPGGPWRAGRRGSAGRRPRAPPGRSTREAGEGDGCTPLVSSAVTLMMMMSGPPAVARCRRRARRRAAPRRCRAWRAPPGPCSCSCGTGAGVAREGVGGGAEALAREARTRCTGRRSRRRRGGRARAPPAEAEATTCCRAEVDMPCGGRRAGGGHRAREGGQRRGSRLEREHRREGTDALAVPAAEG
jgi:hypothetical protein